MKKKILFFCIYVFLISCISLALSSCALINGKPEDKPKTYLISYHDGNGTKKMTVEENKLYSLDFLPRKEGYNFEGLFDSPQGGTQFVNSMGNSLSVFTDGRDMFLYAQFSPRIFTVRYDLQKGNFVNHDSTQYQAKYGDSLISLPTAECVVKEHYVFEGWYTKPNGQGNRVQEGTQISSSVFEITSSDDLYLYANYTLKKYTLTFDFGDSVQESIEAYYGDTVSNSLFPRRDNGMQEIVSWIDYENNNQNVTSIKLQHDTILHAKWRNYRVIKLHATESEKKEVKVYEKDEQSIYVPSRTGYEFLGWYDSSTNENNKIEKIVYSEHNAPTYTDLYAHWNEIEYKAEFVVKYDGVVGETPPITYTIETERELPTLSKENYVFLGWCKKENLSDTPIKTISKGTYAIEKLYAKFKGVDINVNLDTDGGWLNSSEVYVEYSARFKLPVPSNPGNRFLGWYNSAEIAVTDDGGYSYQIWDNLKQGTTLKAKWKIIEYKLVLNFAGGEEQDYASVFYYGNTIKLPTPKKSGYVFCGWFTSANVFYYDLVEDSRSDLTLTAKWATATIHNEGNFWFNTVDKTSNKNMDVATHSINVNLPNDIKQAVQNGKIGVKITAQTNCSVRSMGNATAIALVTVNINGKSFEGARASAKGGGYNIWNDAKTGSWKETSKIIEEKIILQNLNPITIGASYQMTSDKENSKVKIDLNFLFAKLVVELYNI